MATVAVHHYRTTGTVFDNTVDAVEIVTSAIGDGDLYVGSREVIDAVKEDRINQSPPRRGSRGKLPDDAFQHLCDLFFSFSAIAQHNCEEALTRRYLVETLEEVVSPYFEDTGDTMHYGHLWERVEKENAYRQNIDTADYRQALRVSWFTVGNLLKHYGNAEKFLVDNGFARLATKEEKEQTNENIKWYDDQRNRGMNGDEMAWGLDADANGLGGRPGATFITDLLKNSGQASQHSATRVTLFCGMTFGDEALPPLLILPAGGESKRVQTELVQRMHQIEGQYGHEHRKRFSPMIAASPKGSMNATILNSYMQYLTQLYPDCEDTIKKRLFFKLDNGVGRDNDEFLFNSKSHGVYIWPGLPNSSEGTQEMDALFAFFKSLMENNRRTIYQAKQKAGYGGVSMLDLPFILFGGNYDAGDGTFIDLPNAFEIAFDAPHLKAAREKCGYCPANRNALNHRKCHRESGQDLESLDHVLSKNNTELMEYIQKWRDDFLRRGDDGLVDSYTSTLAKLEDMNKDAADRLEATGFNPALTRKTIKENEEFAAQSGRASIQTFPVGSRERQDQMRDARYAGEYFHITSGGDANNCTDILMSKVRESLVKKRETLQKKKEDIEDRQNLVLLAEAIMDALPPGKDTPARNEDLKKCIMWKKNMKSNPKGNKKALLEQWNACKDDPSPTEQAWTTKHEKQLRDAESGDINDLVKSSQFKHAKAVKCTYIRKQASVLDQSEKAQVLLSLYQSLGEDERAKFKAGLAEIDEEKEVVFNCFDYNSDDDSILSSSSDLSTTSSDESSYDGIISTTDALHNNNDGSPNTSVISSCTQDNHAKETQRIHDPIVPATCFLDESQEERQEQEAAAVAGGMCTINHETHIIEDVREDIADIEPSNDREILVSWAEMTVEQLKDECRKRNIKNIRKNSKHATLVRYLEQYEQDMQGKE